MYPNKACSAEQVAATVQNLNAVAGRPGLVQADGLTGLFSDLFLQLPVIDANNDSGLLHVATCKLDRSSGPLMLALHACRVPAAPLALHAGPQRGSNQRPCSPSPAAHLLHCSRHNRLLLGWHQHHVCASSSRGGPCSRSQPVRAHYAAR